REKTWEQIGGREYGLVAAYRRHRGKRVHALAAGDSRHQFHGERGRSGRGDLGDRARRAERPQKSDQHLSTANQWQVGGSRLVVGAMAQHLDYDVGRREYIGARFRKLRAFGNEGGVFVTGVDPRAFFDQNLATGLQQNRHYGWHHGDPPFTGIGFLGHANDHDRTIAPLIFTRFDYRLSDWRQPSPAEWIGISAADAKKSPSRERERRTPHSWQ